MKRAFMSIVCICVFATGANLAHAVPITFEFTGSLTGVYGPIGLPDPFIGIFSRGQAFSGSFTYDSDAPVTGQGTGPQALSYSGAISNFHAQIGGLYADFDNGGISVRNDDDLGGGGDLIDSIVAHARTDLPSRPTNVTTNIVLPGYELESASFYIQDSAAAMFDSPDLPLYAPDLTDTWNYFFLEFGLIEGTAEGSVNGKLETLTSFEGSAVPEPTTVLLVGCGALMLAGMGRKRKNR